MAKDVKTILSEDKGERIDFSIELAQEVIGRVYSLVRQLRRLAKDDEHIKPGTDEEALAVSAALIASFQDKTDLTTCEASADFLIRTTAAVKNLIENAGAIDWVVALMQFVKMGLANMTDEDANEFISKGKNEEQVS